MRSRGSLLTSNALIQRVRGHRAMATLYRSDVDDIAAVPQPPATPIADQDRASIPKASLVPPGSNLPVGRVFAVIEGMRPVSQAHHQTATPARGPLPVQPRRIQRQETASSQIQAAPEQTTHRPTATSTPEIAGERPSPDEGFDWISDRQWTALKSFMEGHQEKLAREATGQEQAELQKSPEEKAQRESREQAQAELIRRQELARSGRLPRAKIEYVSEKKTPEESGPPTPGDVSQRLTQKPDDVRSEAPTELSASKPAADIGPEAIDSPAERSRPVGETAPEPQPQKSTIESSKSPAEPVQPAEFDQIQHPAPEKIQRQLDEPLREQRRPGESKELDLTSAASKLSERGTDEEKEELSPSRPTEPGLDLALEEPTGAFQQDVGEGTELAETKPSVIQREPTGKSPEVKPVESQPLGGIDQQTASESAIAPTQPPGEQKPAGLGRRLLDAARSLLGREEGAPESVSPAEELSARPPADFPTASAGKVLQRKPLMEELADEPSGVAGEEPVEFPKTFQAEEPIEEAIDIGQASSQVASKEFPAQIQEYDQPEIGPDDQKRAGETEEKQVTAEEGSKTKTIPPGQGEDIASQEHIGEAIPASTDLAKGETLVQAAEPTTESTTGVEDQLLPPRSQGPIAEPSVEEREDDTDLETLASATDQTITQTLPLQKAWPVQELRPPKDLPPSMTRPPDTSKPGSTAQRKPAGDDAFADEVHKATKDVMPGKQTDSSVELVTPRKPRPSHPSAPKPAPDVQRKPPESRQRDLVESVPAEAAAPELPEKKHYLVPTEIGDLPSDLWQMLGEKPPKPQEKTPTLRQQAELSAAQALQLMPETNGAPAQVAEMPSPLITQEFPVPFLQRAVRIEELGTVTESEPRDTESTQRPEVDVDQLAQEVFAEIKRRLKVEWERGRGRF